MWSTCYSAVRLLLLCFAMVALLWAGELEGKSSLQKVIRATNRDMWWVIIWILLVILLVHIKWNMRPQKRLENGAFPAQRAKYNKCRYFSFLGSKTQRAFPIFEKLIVMFRSRGRDLNWVKFVPIPIPLYFRTRREAVCVLLCSLCLFSNARL